LRCAEKARQDLERESRLAEMLIGELLGPAENHGPATLTSCQGLNESDRRRFRTLAENRQQVEALLDRGVVKRKALLDAILENARLAHGQLAQDPRELRSAEPERMLAANQITEARSVTSAYGPPSHRGDEPSACGEQATEPDGCSPSRPMRSAPFTRGARNGRND
jgi:hypothetical protein